MANGTMTGASSKGAQAPAMQQYLREKAAHPDALLFFRMGDFYELFFDDALTAAKALDLTLTSRNKNEVDSIPMCGVPYHAAQTYVARLLDLGHMVAICEQLEDPSKAKGIVRRGVVRVLTPALVLDGDALDARANQFLAAAVPPEGGAEMPGAWAIAAYDLSTGEIFSAEVPDALSLLGELARLDVRELLCPADAEVFVRAQVKVLPRVFVRAAPAMTATEAVALLAKTIPEGELRSSLEGLAPAARVAAAVALRYAVASQPGHSLPVQRLGRLDPKDHLHLDETTQCHLELFRTMRGEKKGTLLAHLDATVTAMGARRLRTWLAFPLQSTARIRRRHDAVDALVTYPELRAAVRESLGHVPDLERIAIRASLGAATPRDLGHLRDGLGRVPPIMDALARQDDIAGALEPVRVKDLCGDLYKVLAGSLADAPPGAVDDGGVFRAGFDPELDRYTGLRANGKELITLEREILEAEEKVREIEAARFEQLRAKVAESAPRLSRLSVALADLDALASFAETAHRRDYVRPTVDDGAVIDLKDSRHPVVETVLEPGAFVPNDVLLDMQGARLMLVTGPNMAGKSTVMRQVALIALMAQAGSFVPAREAKIGRVDRIFTRVGASDDLSRGQSTFMVEMRETASILRGATARSLVIFDEIGRGTSTFDGLAIAWAVAEYLHDVVRARSMFATHYHELCALAETRKHAVNVNVSARETGDDIVFLHKLSEGGASRSYGVAVAKLAGLPEPVLARARALLKEMERGEGPFRRAPQQMGLFEGRATPMPPAPHPALEALAAADVNRMTPLDALHLMAQLKRMIEGYPPRP